MCHKIAELPAQDMPVRRDDCVECAREPCNSSKKWDISGGTGAADWPSDHRHSRNVSDLKTPSPSVRLRLLTTNALVKFNKLQYDYRTKTFNGDRMELVEANCLWGDTWLWLSRWESAPLIERQSTEQNVWNGCSGQVLGRRRLTHRLVVSALATNALKNVIST